jgi:DNA polymerase-3 subunit beta
MKLICEREKLLHAFQMAASVAPSRSPKPILQNVKLEASADVTTLMATDLDFGIRIEAVGVQVESPGCVILPIGRFLAILRESSEEKVEIASDGTKTHVRGGRSEFFLPSENPDEFPDIAQFHEDRYSILPARFFRELIRRTVFATDNESGRYALGGVLLEIGETEITGVGTDGRRLARQQGPVKSNAGASAENRENTIIPTRSMQLLERVIGDSEEEIWIAARDNDMLVKSQRATIYTRLVEGRFPKWRDVVPKFDQMTRIELVVGPFHSTVRQAAIVTSEDHRGVDFTFGDGKVVLVAHGAELGESKVELPIAYDGPEISVTLDPRFVGDFLKVLDPDTTFTLHVRNEESPVVAVTGDGYSYVVMPLARD